LLFTALLANKLSSLLMGLLKEDGTLSEDGERKVIYVYALWVPVLSSLCTSLQQVAQASEGTVTHSNDNVTMVVRTCFQSIKDVFTKGLEHENAKVVQTSISSMQSLAQNPATAIMCPSIIPCLLYTLVKQPSVIPTSAVESAWGVISAIVVAQQGNEASTILKATTGLVIKAVLCVADYSKQHPDSFGAQTSAMAQCLVQVARSDQQGMKAEVSTMSPEGQQTIQQLMRDHMTAASRGTGVASEPASNQAAPKIELKIKF